MKTYLGDGVYAEFNGYQIALTCDCMSQPNTIFLEPEVFERLQNFVEKIRNEKNEQVANDAE